MSLPIPDLENFRPMDFCPTECTNSVPGGQSILGWHYYKKQRNLKHICQVILFCVCFNQITKCGPCQHSHTSIGRTSANRQMNHFVVITAHGKPMDETCLCTSGAFSLKMNIITVLSTLDIREETQIN